ncbi:MAG TPA: 16S rRNA (cytosine(967)-C(5))-methyltransferase RsmB [Bacillales bacterium]|nr:16S rRNA (cytosine(967)-C(5))-methyltransferase RsmB [Bacillales bacterium]
MAQQTARDAALAILLKIEQREAYSHLLIHRAVAENRLDPKDKALLTRLVYGTVQHQNTLDFYLDAVIKKQPEKWVRVLLRLAVYQMAYLDKVPDRAVLHETVEIAKRRGHRGTAGFVNGVLRALQREGFPDPKVLKDPSERLAVQTSHPAWLLNRWLEQYGLRTVQHICEANNTAPKVTARINRTRTSKDHLLQRLEEEGVKAKSGNLAPEAIEITEGTVQDTENFRDGLFTIQDESSMLAAHALDVAEGMKVLDGCAAPGGKTTHIAELMSNTGTVVGLDLHKHKIKLIEQQAQRLGLTNVKAEALDSRLAGQRFGETRFDRILVDAPCSGFGVIRRKPDIKWRKTPNDVRVLSRVQGDILQALAPLLKPGGKLVYSTCTVGTEENDAVITSFLRNHHDFVSDPTLKDRMPPVVGKCVDAGKNGIQILPHDFGTDGFYIAALQKEEAG